MKKIFTSALFFFSLVNLTAQQVWTTKANYGGGTVTEACGFGIGNFVYVVSDLQLWEYDPNNDTWTQKAAFTGTQRLSAVGFSIGAKGYYGTGGSFNDFYEYDQAANTWTAKANFGGTGREGAVGIAVNGKGYIGTGGSYLNDWWEYDPALNTWAQKANLNGPGRYHAGAFAIGTKGYVCTGFNGSFFNDLLEYDPSNNMWTSKANLPSFTRDRPEGFAANGKGYICCGWTGSTALNDFWEYDPLSNSWTQMPAFPGAPRYNSVGISANGKCFVGTGYTTAGIAQDWYQFGSSCPVFASATGLTCASSCDGTATVTSPSDSAVISYSWNTTPIQTTQTATGLCAGVYQVTVTDTAGCVSTQTVIINSPPAITATFTSVQPMCYGDSNGSLCIGSIQNGSPPYSYNWSTGAVTSCITNIPAGTYFVTITDANACTNVVTASLAQPAALALIINPSNPTCGTCTNGSAAASISGGTAPYTYSWSTGQTSAFINNLGQGTYWCCVTDGNNCTSCDTVMLTPPAGIELAEGMSVAVYPNPASDFITVKTTGFSSDDLYITLTDLKGRKTDAPVELSKSFIRINISKLPAGMYTLQIRLGDFEKTMAVVKE